MLTTVRVLLTLVGGPRSSRLHTTPLPVAGSAGMHRRPLASHSHRRNWARGVRLLP